jgi:3D (Asp-Asp-Asp) domain-containing protein
MKGKPKRVGVTASGTLARRGTVAADPKVFKPGSRLSIPGYGTGLVEDVGGSIKGRHIDVWFASHEEALEWGARWLKVELEQEGG